MPRRHYDYNTEEPPQKKSFIIPEENRIDISVGETLTDISGKQWKLGKPIGLGGFGVIHEISEKKSHQNNKYVVKIEAHSSGPLFTEINCYLRIAKREMINEWKKQKKLPSLGMPNYVASGSHVSKGTKYRFLVIPRYQKDLELILQEKKKFNLKTVLLISSQILHTLEYIHSKGYIHSDIKAANIMLNKIEVDSKVQDRHAEFSTCPIAELRTRYPTWRTCKGKKVGEIRFFETPKKGYDTRKLKAINYNEDLYEVITFPAEGWLEASRRKEERRMTDHSGDKETDQLYMLDYGLASKYKLSSGEHRNGEDQRKAHAGTLLFCSRDAHCGLQSRRSDLESLAYNMVYWLTGSLPWIGDLEDPEMVWRKKRRCFADTLGFLYFCMPDPPRILKEFFHYIKNLDMQDAPDYNGCQQFIKKALREHGYKCQDQFDFDNLEGWGLAKKSIPKKLEIPVDEFTRPPLLSNLPVKPKLREKNNKNKKAAAALKWSRMLSDPEVLLKKRRNDCSEPSPVAFLDFKLEEMNPTATMREVFHRYEERKGLSPNSCEEYDLSDIPEGYTPAMAAVHQKMLEQRALEEAVVEPIKKNKKTKKVPRRHCNNDHKESTKTKSRSTSATRSYSLRG